MIIKNTLKDGCFILRQPFLFILVFILFQFTSCQKTESFDSQEQDILLKVDEIEVTVFDFETSYVKNLIKTGRNDTKKERFTFVNEMIDNLVLAKESKVRGNLDNPIYRSAVNYHQRKSMMEAYYMDEVGRMLEPLTDDEIRLAYAKKQRKVYVRHLFSMKESELWEPYQRLERGESFVDVANDFYETMQYDSTAGYLGPISYFGVDDAFADAAFSTNQGDYTKPIRSMFGYHIIYIEYIEFPAMLTESDYQYRKSGVSSQLRLRKQSLVSNNYVRDLMSTLLVEVDSKNVLSLMETIKSLSSENVINSTPESPEQQTEIWNDQRLDELKASFDKDKVLTTYLFGGKRVEFTFDDYTKWLPYLPFSESKNRTGASVGRALSNEVLYQLASLEDYDEDERVKKEVRKRGYDILSELYQYQLTVDAINDEEPIEVPNEFKDRLIRNKQIQIKAEYWKIIANDLSEAERIKKELVEGNNPEQFPSYYKRNFEVIDPTELDYYLIKDGLIGKPVLGHSNEDGWLVLNLVKREVSEINSNTKNYNLDTRYKVYKNLNDEIVELREYAEIKLDTLLFDEIYRLKKEKAEEVSN